MFENKIVLVTGGSRGIGKAVAIEFAKNNEKSGFVSSGSTAAIMVLSRLHMGMIV